ncbi:hypothetical protein MLD38_013513 [Melastoma candidum]|uniref:Uncharacterized protein n=2 Tax=Melastoma candidum TaxID=119954 RepID=A0ACB9RI99_9MYRT|nr:hypothetical protein MLD38_013513 [Melastoma candidum]
MVLIVKEEDGDATIEGGLFEDGGRPDGKVWGKGKRDSSKKREVYEEIMLQMKVREDGGDDDPGFADELWVHLSRLPTRYAMDVNVERSEDVVMHMRLLRSAQSTVNMPAVDVRLVQVHPNKNMPSNDLSDIGVTQDFDTDLDNHSGQLSMLPPPTFGSSSSHEILNYDAGKATNLVDRKDSESSVSQVSRPMHEITFSMNDKPKLLSQLASLLADMGLNIQEAHAFSTVDGYSLDVFVVDGWPYEETDKLRALLEEEVAKMKQELTETVHEHGRVLIPDDDVDVWELDLNHLRFGKRVASGSYGDLYKGTYFSQDVAIKVLSHERLSEQLQSEFAQEVFIMRKVRHKNVVQFIGACTKPPNLYIVTEFMLGGSVYDYLHKHRGSFKLPTLLKVAIDVSKGMQYLHQSNIIHRDLKAANLLMDENEVVKVADFGVARVKSQSGVMTAETGTYRWMAPEVIEHKPYDHKADVFSFGIVLWELLTGKLPYEYLTPLQAAISVVQKGLRPTIPKHAHPRIVDLMEKCWQQDPALRPDFSEITGMLQHIAQEVGDNGDERHRERSSGLFSVLRRGHH